MYSHMMRMRRKMLGIGKGQKLGAKVPRTQRHYLFAISWNHLPYDIVTPNFLPNYLCSMCNSFGVSSIRVGCIYYVARAGTYKYAENYVGKVSGFHQS
jgi:hypothetical protein